MCSAKPLVDGAVRAPGRGAARWEQRLPGDAGDAERPYTRWHRLLGKVWNRRGPWYADHIVVGVASDTASVEHARTCWHLRPEPLRCRVPGRPPVPRRWRLGCLPAGPTPAGDSPNNPRGDTTVSGQDRKCGAPRRTETRAGDAGGRGSLERIEGRPAHQERLSARCAGRAVRAGLFVCLWHRLVAADPQDFLAR